MPLSVESLLCKEIGLPDDHSCGSVFLCFLFSLQEASVVVRLEIGIELALLTAELTGGRQNI
jgi:hypothetical protein